MHLVDLLAQRPVPAAGVYLSLTRRCPLTCAHCSTNSLMTSEEHSADLFLNFLDSLSTAPPPQIVYLTGGEALLRPDLVYQLGLRAHAAGARVALISGMFFARQAEIPAPIRRALTQIDHFAASLDVFHEAQVARSHVLRVLAELLDQGKDVSLQVTGLDEDDPYLAEVTTEVCRTFDDRLPILVAKVGPVGRARQWLQADEAPPHVHPDSFLADPCAMATWPNVTYDGTVVACCSQDVVDGRVPPHLRLGHVAEDDWATIRQRCLSSTLLRAIRVYGPPYLAATYGSGKASCDGYCATCFKLSDDPSIEEALTPVMATPGMPVVEAAVAQMQQTGLVQRYGVGKYGPLALLGAPLAAAS
jgi:MoaA/NifB/PqqE/SkfB family radical SAM enzyme